MIPKVTVIIPIFNTSKYIQECADSLFQQTFQDLEYIFVNDCSTDNSMNILQSVIEKYPNRKEQIHIINQPENKGLALTRRKGLEIAKGEYIMNVDSDDYLELDMISLLVLAAEREKADVVVCDFFKDSKNNRQIIKDIVSNDNKTNIRELILDNQTHPSLCNKLISKQVLTNKICDITERLDYSEDRYLCIRIFYLSKKIYKINVPLYHYRVDNPNSITKQKNESRFIDTIYFWHKLDEFLTEQNLIEDFKSIVDLSKTRCKVNLMFDTNNKKFRIRYADVFNSESEHNIKKLKLSGQFMLYLVKHKYFNCTSFLRTLVKLKNSILS